MDVLKWNPFAIVDPSWDDEPTQAMYVEVGPSVMWPFWGGTGMLVRFGRCSKIADASSSLNLLHLDSVPQPPPD